MPGGTSSSASPWPWQPQRTTQPHGDRSLPGPECGQESLRTLGCGGRRSTSSTPPCGDRSLRLPGSRRWLCRCWRPQRRMVLTRQLSPSSYGAPLEDKRKEEQLAKEKEEERKQKVLDSLEQKLQQMLHESSSSAVRKRKRKKRRKRRTPRTSSRPLRGRRRQRQWRVRHACFAGSNAPRDVFPVADDWTLLLGNMAGMDQKDSFFVGVMAVAYARLVFLVSLVPLCSLLSWSGPDAPHHGRVSTRRTVIQWAGSTGDSAPRAVFLSLLSGP